MWMTVQVLKQEKQYWNNTVYIESYVTAWIPMGGLLHTHHEISLWLGSCHFHQNVHCLTVMWESGQFFGMIAWILVQLEQENNSYIGVLHMSVIVVSILLVNLTYLEDVSDIDIISNSTAAFLLMCALQLFYVFQCLIVN